MNEITKIALFQKKEIRKTFHNEEWWFSVVDVVEALTDSSNSRVYWGVLKGRLEKEEKVEVFTNCKQLKMEAPDGKLRSHG